MCYGWYRLIGKNLSMPNCKDKFHLANKFNFTCQFCEAKLPFDDLEIDHMVPKSMGGSDNEENLTCACKKCNRSKSDTIAFPRSMCEEPEGKDKGWKRLRSFNDWQVLFHATDIVLEHQPSKYYINLKFLRDGYLTSHMEDKIWFQEGGYVHFYDALDYLDLFINSPRNTKGTHENT